MYSFAAYWQACSLQMSGCDAENLVICCVINRKFNTYFINRNVPHYSGSADVKNVEISVNSFIMN